MRNSASEVKTKRIHLDKDHGFKPVVWLLFVLIVLAGAALGYYGYRSNSKKVASPSVNSANDQVSGTSEVSSNNDDSIEQDLSNLEADISNIDTALGEADKGFNDESVDLN